MHSPIFQFCGGTKTLFNLRMGDQSPHEDKLSSASGRLDSVLCVTTHVSCLSPSSLILRAHPVARYSTNIAPLAFPSTPSSTYERNLPLILLLLLLVNALPAMSRSEKVDPQHDLLLCFSAVTLQA